MKCSRILRPAAIPALALALVLAGCGRDARDGKGRLTAAVTIAPVASFVEAVCGDLVDVVTLVPPGFSPESYEASPRDIEALGAASVYFAIGVPAEPSILPSLGDMPVVELHKEAAAVYPEREFAPGERDPHVWLSPRRAIVMVEAIAREMSRIDAANKTTYEENAAVFIAQLRALDGEIASALSGISNRKIIVYHPAFGYLADDYGLTMYALEEEGKAATPRHMQEMVDLARIEHIKVIFYQEEMYGGQSEAFAEEIGGRAMQLSPLAPDYVDNLRRMASLMAEAMQ